MLELKRINYHPATSEYPVLKEITLQGTKGRPLIISGPSGSGKTSLIEVISGITAQNNGNIFWNKILVNERQRKRISGVVFQFPERHFIGLTVAQELRIGLRRLSGDLQTETLKKVGLENINITDSPEKLSGGQQRRIAIAVQLIRKPQILLLDEPTAGLDWSVRDEILKLIKLLSQEQLLIIVTHEPQLFKACDSKKYQLNNGVLNQLTK
ncbi:ABC transporter ATP-binding protein [Prochlorococcus sp. MIT 0603]|nr:MULTISPECIES: ABC transporter ATP-binding protein [unclassified Prochlorococcus]KGG15351.1 putative ABC transporter [Prochlorococcus sp. MIT 0602]KGG17629.1 putative ABC transporter [Prochlorococcus sp. MIT 0603]